MNLGKRKLSKCWVGQLPLKYRDPYWIKIQMRRTFSFLRSTSTRTKLTVLNCDSRALSAHPLTIHCWFLCQSEPQPVKIKSNLHGGRSSYSSALMPSETEFWALFSLQYAIAPSALQRKDGWEYLSCPVCSFIWKPPPGWEGMSLWWRTLSFNSHILRDWVPSRSCCWNTC